LFAPEEPMPKKEKKIIDESGLKVFSANSIEKKQRIWVTEVLKK
jgi:hypothetical protein